MLTRRRVAAAILIGLALGVLFSGMAVYAPVDAQGPPGPCGSFDMGKITVPPELDSIIGFLALNPDGSCEWTADTEALVDVVVKLERTDVSDPAFDQETMTSANGCFAFTDLPDNSEWTVTVPSTDALMTYGLKCGTYDGNANTFDVIIPDAAQPLHGFYYEPTPTHGGPGASVTSIMLILVVVIVVAAVIIYLLPKMQGER